MSTRSSPRRGVWWVAYGAIGGLALSLLLTVVWSAPGQRFFIPSTIVAAEPVGPTAAAALDASDKALLTASDQPSAERPLESLDEPAAPASTALDVAATPADAPVAPMRLAQLPFRTQRDDSRFAGSNCGPAALAMVLESWGVSQGNDDLRYLTHTYQGTWGRRGGTALEHMAQVAEDFGIHATGLYEGDQFRQWSLAEVRAEVERGHPVIALVKYRLLPGREYSTVRYDHYIVLWDVTADGFVYNDPIYPDAAEGFARYMSDTQLDAAMRPTMWPRQAVAFAGPLS